MYSSTISKKSKFSIGGVAMWFAFFKNRVRHNRYRRKPIYLYNNCLDYDLYYIVMLNKLK